jgi:ATP-binding cassette subfamily F protein 2
MQISQLSDGQKSRVVFAWIAEKHPHLLLLDEPTNHLDMETIDSLANAINLFDGGLILVSHDMRLISQVADDIWICDKGTLTRYEGSILNFKMQLKKEISK